METEENEYYNERMERKIYYDEEEEENEYYDEEVDDVVEDLFSPVEIGVAEVRRNVDVIVSVRPEHSNYPAKEVERFIYEWERTRGIPAKINRGAAAETLNGYYVYPATAHKWLDAIIVAPNSNVPLEMPIERAKVFKGLDFEPGNLRKGNGLAFLKITNGIASEVEYYNYDISLDNLHEGTMYAAIRRDSPDSRKSYASLTTEDWEEMTLEMVRRIEAAGEIPSIMMVNAANSRHLSHKKGGLPGTQHYILQGIIQHSRDQISRVLDYQKNEFLLDFPITDHEEHLNVPAWIHIYTEDGVPKRTEIQIFEDSDLEAMAQGMINAAQKVNNK